jgi:TPR repeat protein
VNQGHATELYTLGCGRGSGRACAALAAITERKDPRDPGVVRLYERACVQGYLSGCTDLARLYDTGAVIPRDTGRAIALYRSTCALDEPSACVNLATLELATGHNAGDAVALLQRACSEQLTVVCGKLAELYLAGTGVAVDAPRALGLFERGCKGGDATACGRQADLYREGRGTPRDPRRALGLYDQACAAGVASACMEAGHEYRRAGRDAQAQDRYEKACRAGITYACKYYRK